jgi:hypothetical protein
MAVAPVPIRLSIPLGRAIPIDVRVMPLLPVKTPRMVFMFIEIVVVLVMLVVDVVMFIAVIVVISISISIAILGQQIRRNE